MRYNTTELEFEIRKGGKVRARFINPYKVSDSIREKVALRSDLGLSTIGMGDEMPPPTWHTLKFTTKVSLSSSPILGLVMGTLVLPFIELFTGKLSNQAAILGLFAVPLVACSVGGMIWFARQYFKDRKILKSPTTLNQDDVWAIRSATESLTFGRAVESARLDFQPGCCKCAEMAGSIFELHTSITGSNCWSSRHVAEPRRRLNLKRTRDEFIRDVLAFHINEQHLGPRPRGREVSAELATREWDNTTAMLATAWSGFQGRLRALEELRSSVEQLDHTLNHSSVATRAETVAEHVSNLIGQHEVQSSTSNTMGTPAEHIAAVESAIHSLIQYSPDRTEALKSIHPKAH